MKPILFGLGVGVGWAGIAGSGLDRPQTGAAALVAILAVWVGWRLGRNRGFAIANANANASAVAAASATAEAMSAAQATGGAASVNLQVVLPGSVAPVSVDRFVPPHRERLEAARTRSHDWEEWRLAQLDPDMDLEDIITAVSDSSEEEVLERSENGERE